MKSLKGTKTKKKFMDAFAGGYGLETNISILQRLQKRKDANRSRHYFSKQLKMFNSKMVF